MFSYLPVVCARNALISSLVDARLGCSTSVTSCGTGLFGYSIGFFNSFCDAEIETISYTSDIIWCNPVQVRSIPDTALANRLSSGKPSKWLSNHRAPRQFLP